MVRALEALRPWTIDLPLSLLFLPHQFPTRRIEIKAWMHFDDCLLLRIGSELGTFHSSFEKEMYLGKFTCPQKFCVSLGRDSFLIILFIGIIMITSLSSDRRCIKIIFKTEKKTSSSKFLRKYLVLLVYSFIRIYLPT